MFGVCSILFCEWARLSLKLELFTGKFSLSLSYFFFSLWLSHSLGGLLSHVSSLRLSSGNSGPVPYPKHATHTSLFSPCLLVVEMSVWATSLLGVAVRCTFFGFFFPLPVILPSEVPKLPTDPPVRGFPTVWRLLLLHDSLPRMGLRP